MCVCECVCVCVCVRTCVRVCVCVCVCVADVIDVHGSHNRLSLQVIPVLLPKRRVAIKMFQKINISNVFYNFLHLEIECPHHSRPILTTLVTINR